MPVVDPRLVIAEILRNSPDGINRTKLCKAFYLAHLIYSELATGLLTKWPIARMPQGPGIDHGFELLDELEARGLLQHDESTDGPYRECVYKLTDDATLTELPEPARKAIQDATKFVLPKTASEISALTHEHSRSWIEGKNGQILEIYADLIPDEEYEHRSKQLSQLDSQIDAAFKGFDE